MGILQKYLLQRLSVTVVFLSEVFLDIYGFYIFPYN